MITFAQNTQKQEIIRIWQTSFPEDSLEFVNMYFTKKYKKENTLVYMIDNQVVSCLQMLPYSINFHNTVCKLSYISGAATLPDHKNRGIMGELLRQSFVEMRNRGDVFTVLIPQEAWLIEFYKKYGYTTCFEHSLTPISLFDDCFSTVFSVSALDNIHLQDAYDYYNNYCKQQNLFVLKTFDDFLVIWEELKLFSGNIFLCYEAEKICGICFCFVSEKEVTIKDLVVDSETARKQLLLFAMEKYNTNVLQLCEPLYFCTKEKPQHKENGMARIIHVEKALQIYASFYNQLQITIKVQDNAIAENNGIFYLYNGNCTRKQNNCFDIEVDINLLTQLLFGYQTGNLPSNYHVFPQHHPFMSLMLE